MVGDPARAIVGGIAIEATGDVARVYAAVGITVFLIAFAFRFTSLGHAEDFLPREEAVSGSPPKERD